MPTLSAVSELPDFSTEEVTPEAVVTDDELTLETLEADVTEDTPAAVPFADLGLPRGIVTALEREGLTNAFPIQAATIPEVLAGRDVLGRGATGSGKTLAFGLPLVAKLAGARVRPGRPLGLVLVPTRELALQVTDALAPLGRAVGVRVRPVVGGAAMSRQLEDLRRGVHVVVATPGRLEDHIRRGSAVLDDVEITAIDEADQMADMGFLPVVRGLLDQVRPDGQRLLFSATLDNDVDTIVREYLTDPVTHSLAPSTASVDTMEHHMLQVTHQDKVRVAAELVKSTGRTIMFVKTQAGADRLAEQLTERGVFAEPLHGGRTQGQRNRVLSNFKNGRAPVLVATDVAARGVHVDGVGLVVHFDPPTDPKSYLHRAGRTARAGASGVVATLVAPYSRRAAHRLAKLAGINPIRSTITPEAPLPSVLLDALPPAPPPPTAEELAAAEARRRRSRDFDSDRGRGGPRRGPRSGSGERTGGYRGGPRRSDGPRWSERSDRGDRGFDRGDRGDRGFDRGDRSGRPERDNRVERADRRPAQRSGEYRTDGPRDNSSEGYRARRPRWTPEQRSSRRGEDRPAR
ncbi:DEAD/DEAH box helicase [Cryptosporangium aurantiacum]|uniref:Superfamily II DNA and RNA helicase n=1 Tax=Cryptosporangium aurantiacum TaxID=134849 RepID=A0A1M7RNT2_9ACTN|nr:DEAD/DEAH box helicase [Cryptosporangium aurantiacum]SHN47973.1 Superfamily II DNA and RNA helicase [Cryptosporangium aurantiacum]